MMRNGAATLASEHPLMGAQGVNVSYRSINSEADLDSASSIGDSSTRKSRFISGIRNMRWGRRKRGDRPRMVDRDGVFWQSFGRWNIRRLKKVADIQKLVESDPFHTLVNQATFKIILGILGLYLSIVFAFSLVYYIISATLGCNLLLDSFRKSYLFSLETMTTVGYGTNDYLFGHCWVMLPMLSTQACIGLLIDAFLIGILFARLSRPQTRATTVVFTKHAVIRRVRGELYFMFQVGELRKHQLLETRVRCYALRHDRISLTDEETQKRRAEAAAAAAAGGGGGVDLEAGECSGDSTEKSDINAPEHVYFQCHNMRLQHPDDELGGNLLLVLPQTVVHRIDAWSPMMPPPRWNSSVGLVQWGLHQDKDIVKAPWEEGHKPDEPLERRESLTSNPDVDKNNLAAVALRSPFDLDEQRDSLAKGDDKYWEVSSTRSEDGAPRLDNSIGYVYRFPDLLKRWDDVDGDRGTWYEVMKRRMLRVETDRRQKEEGRARKALIAEHNSAAAANSLVARRGRGARAAPRRRSSIMHIYEFDDERNAEEASLLSSSPSAGMTRDDSINKMKNMALFPRTTPTKRDDLGTVKEDPDATAAGAGAAEMERDAGRGTRDTDPSSPGHAVEGRGGGGGNGGRPAASPPSPAPCFSPTPLLSPRQWLANEERKAIDVFLRDRELEVVVIIEGTDTSTGNTVQARHSYCWEDIQWDHTFASCVMKGKKGECVIDFERFHDTLEAPADCVDHGFMQSFA